jgi:hypothetical protein
MSKKIGPPRFLLDKPVELWSRSATNDAEIVNLQLIAHKPPKQMEGEPP